MVKLFRSNQDDVIKNFAVVMSVVVMMVDCIQLFPFYLYLLDA